MSFTGTRANTSYPTGYDAGQAGDKADSGPCDVITLTNDHPRTAQVATFTVDAANDGVDHTLSIDGVEITYTSGQGATTSTIASGLADAINAEPLVSGKVLATPSTADVIVTARIAGQGFVAAEADTNLSLVQTTADDDADPIGFGLAVVRDASTPDLGRLAAAANIDDKVYTITPTAANSSQYITTIDIEGQPAPIIVSITSDGSATVDEICDALVAAINTAMPANTVVAAADDATATLYTLTAEVDGLNFTVSTDGRQAVTVSGDTLAERFAGITHRDLGYAVEDDGYPGGSPMSVARKGRYIVDTEDSVSPTDTVYVRVSGSGTVGGFRGSAATGCVPLPRRVARFAEALTSSLAVLELNCEG